MTENNDDNETRATESSVSLETSLPLRPPYPHCNRRVSWASVQLREYPMIPGDNPAAIGGVPVTIQWEPVEEQLFAVDEFEASRSTPRSMIEMRMPPSYRSDLLRRLGFSRGDVTAALKAANIVRAQRRRTAETLNFSVVQESLEKVKRATLNVTLRRGKKVQEKKLLATFRGSDVADASNDRKENNMPMGLDISRASAATTTLESLESLEYSDVGKEHSKQAMVMNLRTHRNSLLMR